jgi:tetratricopeptide (TPR) repeat protein
MKTAKSNRSFGLIVVAGVLAIAVASWARQYINANRRATPKTAAAPDPRLIELDTTLSKLQALVAATPNDPAAHIALADFFQKIGRPNETAGELAVVARLMPNDPYAHIALGNARLATMNHREAEAEYRTVAKRWPGNHEAWQGLATALFHQNRFLEAIGAARKAVRLDKMEPNGRYILGRALLEYALQFPDPKVHSAELKESQDNLLLVLGAWPDKGDIYYRLGRASMELHDKGHAVKNLRRAMELLPNKTEIPWLLAQSFSMAGDKPAARKVLEEALVKFPKHAGMHDMLGKLLLTSGELDADKGALEHFRLAVQLAPNIGPFQERYGTSCLRANQLEEARTALEKAQEINPNRAYPYQQLSAVYTRLGDSRKASLAAKTAMEMVFNDQQLKRFEALSAAEPNNTSLRLILAERYHQLKMDGAARDELIRVLRSDPKNTSALKGLAQLSAHKPDAAPAK